MMGPSPSVTRAYIMIVLYYLAKYLDRSSCPINNLGLACFFILLYDPMSFSYLSFQLSFLSCLGIFFFYPYFSSFIPLKKGLLGGLYLFYMHAMALSFSVMILIFPLLFFLFGKISLLGLVYNLFFPVEVLFLFSSLLILLFFHPFIPILTNALFPLLNQLTKIALIPVLNPPMYLDFTLQWTMGKQTAVFFTIFFLLLGIYAKITSEKAKEKSLNFYL